MASLTLHPGARVRLKGQDAHVPDFYVVRCEYDQCWVRQRNWSPEAAINVRFSQLFIPGPPSVAAVAGGSALALPPLAPVAPAMAEVQSLPQRRPNNVIDMAAYRRRKAR